MRELKWKYLIIIVSLLNFACEKGEMVNQANSSSFIKVMNVKDSYVSRDVIALQDGSFLLSAVGAIENFDANNFPEADLPSLVSRYTAKGDLIWQKELPEAVQVLWHGLELNDGNIAFVGFNSEANSRFVGVVILSIEGEVLYEKSFFNTSRSLPSSYGDNSIDCTLLSNGNIALAMTSSPGSNIPLVPRLIILDSELNTVFERFYNPNNIVQMRDMYQISISEDNEGNILFNGVDRGFENDSLNYFAYILKVRAGSYSPMYHQLFNSSSSRSPSDFAIDNNGKCIWTSTGFALKDSIFNPWFNMRNQEKFKIGPKLQIWITNGDSADNEVFEVSGYPRNGYINTIKRTSDGGYILLGTCNINTNQRFPSDYKIMLIKLSSDLKFQWMKIPSTNTGTISGDIIEIEDGYLISATHLSMRENRKPIVLKTDLKGKLN